MSAMRTHTPEIGAMQPPDYRRRFGSALLMEQGCLKCHAESGVKLDEVRGGISVAVPLEPVYATSRTHNRNINLFHGAAWLLDTGLIGLIALGSKRESAERGRAEQAEELASRDGLTVPFLWPKPPERQRFAKTPDWPDFDVLVNAQ